MKKLIALVATSAFVAGSAQAQEIDTYEPDSSWALDFGEDYCRLGREFSNGDDSVTLLLERTHPNAQVRVIVIGNSVRLFRRAETIGYRWMPSGGPRMAQKLVQETGNGQQYLNLGPSTLADFGGGFGGPGGGAGPGAGPGAGAGAGAGFTPPAPGTPFYSRDMEVEQAGNVNGIRLTEGLTSSVQINTGSLARPIEGMQACADDMLVYWGLDLEAHKTLSRTVVPGDGTVRTGDNGFPTNPSAGWISQNTVGFQDFVYLSGGNNEIRVMVNAQGRPTSCVVHFPSLPESTNESICEQVMENGEFLPALDADGNAIDSYWMTNVFSLTPPFGGR